MSHYTRRDFAKLALAALPAAGLFSVMNRAQAAEVPKGARPKPNSKVNGVQIGLNVPYSFGGRTMPADEIISNCVLLGVNALELRTQPVEAFLGSPVSDVVAARGSAINANEAKANAAKLEAWRLSVSMDRVKAFRQQFDAAGMLIEIVKVDNIFQMSEPVLDYQFHVAGGHGSPVEFIKKNHARISHVHIKDRKYDPATKNGPNTPFGEGDTPIKDVLRVIRDNHYNIQATIEFEYKVPASSDRMTEIARTIKYCRDALA